MRETLTREQEAALDALKATIRDPATPAIVLAIDVPFKAALLGLSWGRLRRARGSPASAAPSRPSPIPSDGSPPAAS